MEETTRLVGIWDYNIDTDHLQWDGVMSRIFGFDEEYKEGSFEMFGSLVHPDDLERVAKAVRVAIANMSQYDAVYRIIRVSDQTERVIHAWGSVFTHSGNKCLVGACDEVTEKSRLYKELQDILGTERWKD